MEEILKMQEVIVGMVRKITSQAKLQRILRLARHLFQSTYSQRNATKYELVFF